MRRYFKKGLNPKNYGVDNVEELVGLVRDAVVLMCPPKAGEGTAGSIPRHVTELGFAAGILHTQVHTRLMNIE